MRYQTLFPWKLVFLFCLVATPLSAAFSPEAVAVSVQSDRLSTPLSVNLTDDRTVRIDGSSNMAAINQLLQQRYQEQYPGIEVEVAQHGTDAALKALLDGDIDLAAIGRSLTQQEQAAGLVEIPVSQEKIAIIVGRENPFDGHLTIDQLVKIFRGEITNWADVGGTDSQIQIVDRPETSDTRLALSQYGLLEEIRRSSLKRSNVVHLETDSTAEVIQALGKDGISYAVLDQIRDQDAVRLIRIAVLQDILPDSSLYPYTFSRSYAYKATIEPTVQSFIGFATAQPGQEAVVAAKAHEAQTILSTIAAAEIAKVSAVQAPAIVPSAIPSSAGESAPILPPSPAKDTQPIDSAIATAKTSATEVGDVAQATISKESDFEQSDFEQSDFEQSDFEQSEPVVVAKENLDKAAQASKETVNAPVENSVSVASVIANSFTKVIKPVPSGRVVTQPELNQQDFDNQPEIQSEIQPSIGSQQPAQAIDPVAETQTSATKPPQSPSLESPLVVEPSQAPAQIPSIDPEQPEQTEASPQVEPDRGFPIWGWLLFPLVLVGLLFRWLNSRKRVRKPTRTAPRPQTTNRTATQTKTQPERAVQSIAPPPVAEVSTAKSPVAETSETLPDNQPAIEADLDAEPTGEAAAEISEPVPAIAPAIAEVLTPVPQDDSEPTVETFKQTFVGYLQGYLSKTLDSATPQECYIALAYLVRDRLFQRTRPEAQLQQPGARLVGEIAAEYVPGPHLANNLTNLGYVEHMQQAMQELGLNLDDLIEQEEEPGLGTGDLGRLMVCYLDALSTAEVPAIGYGIRYEFGIFDQKIQDGWQVEVPDSWLQNGNPWELEAPEALVEVKFGGQTQAFLDDRGQYRVRWIPAEVITGIPYDTPILGYRSNTVNLLRLWKAEHADQSSDQLCQVLYPVDSNIQGKALRLKQQFFLVSCALQDVLRLHRLQGGGPDTLPKRMALQINDTDPTLAVAELMRLLIDEYALDWDKAWEVTQQTLAYTNHSLMPETLDDLWSVAAFSHFLPRHLEIIFEINNRFLEQVRTKYPGDLDRIQRMSLIDERGDRYVRTTYLACVGSHAINGVSKLHTQLLEQTILRDFYELYPEKFSNKTNGITPRRFLLLINPRLANLITSEIGDGWITHLDELKKLEERVGDRQFCQKWQQTKHACKQDLADYIQQQTGISVDVNSLFDIHTMRLHEYTRQHLQILHILTLYNRIKANPELDITPRTFIFGGKAAPDYFIAKLIIKLIHNVATLVNPDPDVQGRLKVVFLPDYNLKVAQQIYPAADVAEYISTAGTEACSTGNMIFALNGATIIGTLDGSNLELRQSVGAENFFLFGLAAQEVVDLRSSGYNPMDDYNANPDLKAALNLVSSGALSNGDAELFRPLVNLLLHQDYYMLLADYPSFLEAQERVSRAYGNSAQWTQMSILNVARTGAFSADRAIAEYGQDIWNIKPIGDRLRQFTQPQAG